ncbi:MAG TPA: Abi family protein, partial [Arthrobacter sp.]|nr:Abi family protein [Arthrobacter sp.]
MSYAKPWLSLGDQLAQLKTRGMLVTDDAAALKALETVGYYRLSAYWHPMRKSEQITVGSMIVSTRLTDNFVAGATFDLVLELCDFDRKLKMILLEAIERVEISVRTQLAHTLGKNDPFGHVNPSSLHGNFTKKPNQKTGKTLHATWLEKYEKQLKESKEEFVTHFKAKYG